MGDASKHDDPEYVALLRTLRGLAVQASAAAQALESGDTFEVLVRLKRISEKAERLKARQAVMLARGAKCGP